MREGYNPKVEILLATYNGEKYISELLDSIINQSYKNIKITIHDDGSSDRTLEILRDYSKKYPEIINLIDDGISTGSALRNFEFLLKNSTEEYIMFADQDDVWLPNKVEATLEKMLSLESKYGKDIPLLVYTDAKVVDEDLNLLSESIWNYTMIDGTNKTFSRCLEMPLGPGFTIMINKKAKDYSLPFSEHALMHDSWISLVVSALGKSEYLEIPTALYRQHNKNTVGLDRFDIKEIIDKFLIFQKKLHEFRERYMGNRLKTQDFLERYSNLLSKDIKEIANFFINAKETNRFLRLFKVVKYGFLWHKSFIINLGKLFLRWFLL